MWGADPQNQPDHTGSSGSPCSNSIHTAAPTTGMAKKPVCDPPNGAHGSAQPDCWLPSTSGTVALIRPVISGSLLSATRPRYLPKNAVAVISEAPAPASPSPLGRGGTRPCS